MIGAGFGGLGAAVALRAEGADGVAELHDLPLERYVETLAGYAGLAPAEAVA